MPLIAVAILSYGAGLLGGFGLGATLTGVCGVAIALAAALHRHAILCAGGVALASGALIAAGTRVSDTRCEREIIRAGVHGAIIEEEAAPGAFVHARALECPVALSLAVETGHAGSGSTVAVRRAR